MGKSEVSHASALAGARVVCLTLAACLLAMPAAAAESIYTPLDLEKCQVLKTYEEGTGVDLKCVGLEGFPVYVSEGDLRFHVSFGAKTEEWRSFSPFNSIHTTVEWRMDDGVPHAAILRYFLENPETGKPEDRGQALVVYKVGEQEHSGCIIGAVDARKTEQANGVARGLASTAYNFKCGQDEPVGIGPDGSDVFSMQGLRPEGQ